MRMASVDWAEAAEAASVNKVTKIERRTKTDTSISVDCKSSHNLQEFSQPALGRIATTRLVIFAVERRHNDGRSLAAAAIVLLIFLRLRLVLRARPAAGRGLGRALTFKRFRAR